MIQSFETKISVNGVKTRVTISYTIDQYGCVTGIDIEDQGSGRMIDYFAAQDENEDILDEVINHIEGGQS